MKSLRGVMGEIWAIIDDMADKGGLVRSEEKTCAAENCPGLWHLIGEYIREFDKIHKAGFRVLARRVVGRHPMCMTRRYGAI